MTDVGIVEFLTARYDEVQQIAEAATPGPWTALDGGVAALDEENDEGGYPWPVSSAESARDREDRVHIAYHDPARVLADIAAKRRIVEAYAGARKRIGEVRRDGYHAYDAQRVQGAESALTVAVVALAAPYADHPDYNPAWRL